MVFALTCYRFGDRKEAQLLFDELERRSSQEYVWLTSFMFMHLIRSEIDEAVRMLRAAKEAHDPLYCWFGSVRRGSSSLELSTDPRLGAILKESGLP
jgi:hypothetical protein